MAQDKQKPGSKGPGEAPVQGEGNYEAARRYDEKLRDHVQHHDVEREARDAEPTSEGEARDMEQAEQAGKRRAKEEDALLDNPQGLGRDKATGAGESGAGDKSSGGGSAGGKKSGR